MPQQYSGIFMMVILFGLMYFMMIRPQKKKDKAIKQMRDSLTIGDEAITIGGIHGKVVKVNDEVVTLEMNHAKQRVEFSKWAIGSVDRKGKDKVEKAVEEIETIEIAPTDEENN